LITLSKELASIQIPQIADDTKHGNCNSTGYIPKQNRFTGLSFNILTGGDDLRGDSSAMVKVNFSDGPQNFSLKAQSDPGWPNNSDNVKSFPIPGRALKLEELGTMIITLTSHNSWSETDDNWNIQSIDVTATGSEGSACVFKASGKGTQPSPSRFFFGNRI
jgi:hypothetical protein